jgi:hypothetical protein
MGFSSTSPASGTSGTLTNWTSHATCLFCKSVQSRLDGVSGMALATGLTCQRHHETPVASAMPLTCCGGCVFSVVEFFRSLIW